MKLQLKQLKRFLHAGSIFAVALSVTACASDDGINNAQRAVETAASEETEEKPETVSIQDLSQEEYEAAFLAEPASQRTIRIGYNGSLCQGAVGIAHELGFFEAEGLDTALTRSDSARDAIAGGQIDTSAGMIAEWLKPVTNGVDIVFTVGLHTGCTSAIVLNESEYETFEDVLGDVIAISGGIGGTYHNIGYRMIAHDGFVADDFVWRDFAADQTLLVLQNGEANAAIVSDQLAEQWIQDGLVRRIRSITLDTDFRDEACCVLGISGSFLAENPVTSEKISRAIYNASVWMNESEENRREASQVLLDNDHISGTVDYAVELLNLYTFGISNEVTTKSLYDSVDEYKSLGVLDESVDVEKLKEQIFHPFDLERLANGGGS